MSEDNSRYLLSVVCGSAGIFEVPVYLNDEEMETYKKEGTSFINRLAKEIQQSPTKYADRKPF